MRDFVSQSRRRGGRLGGGKGAKEREERDRGLVTQLVTGVGGAGIVLAAGAAARATLGRLLGRVRWGTETLG